MALSDRVIGVTGSGKTNFINALTRTPSDESTDDTLFPGTRSVLQRTLEHDGQQLILLDTPGFDNIYLTDGEILTRVAACLETNYRPVIPLGIIFVHRITEVRMRVSAPVYINMLRNQCNGMSVRKICLVTTMWDDVPEQDMAEAEERETVLKKECTEHGVAAIFERFDHGRASSSAWDIMHRLMEDGACWLQRELEDQEKLLGEPHAGEASYNRFRQLLLRRKAVVQRLVDQGTTQGNSVRVIELQAEDETLDAQLRVTFAEMQERKVSLVKRVLRWLRHRRNYNA